MVNGWRARRRSESPLVKRRCQQRSIPRVPIDPPRATPGMRPPLDSNAVPRRALSTSTLATKAPAGGLRKAAVILEEVILEEMTLEGTLEEALTGALTETLILREALIEEVEGGRRLAKAGATGAAPGTKAIRIRLEGAIALGVNAIVTRASGSQVNVIEVFVIPRAVVLSAVIL